MFCACARRRPVAPVAPVAPTPPATSAPTSPIPKRSPAPFVAKIEGFTPEPLMLTIRIPKRTRWAPYDEPHKELFKEKARASLSHLEKLPEGERRFRGAIILFNDIIAQPVILAGYPTFRAVAAKKMEEIETYAKDHPQSRYDDEFREMSYQWHELLTELHDHPLYKE